MTQPEMHPATATFYRDARLALDAAEAGPDAETLAAAPSLALWQPI